MADQQKTEVRETTTTTPDESTTRQTARTDDRVPGNVVAQRVVYYLGGALLALLALRFILQLLGANEGNGFVDFIYGLSFVFVSPFFGIFGTEPTYGASQLETSTLVAIIVYGLLTVGVAKLFTLGSRRADV